VNQPAWKKWVAWQRGEPTHEATNLGLRNPIRSRREKKTNKTGELENSQNVGEKRES